MFALTGLSLAMLGVQITTRWAIVPLANDNAVGPATLGRIVLAELGTALVVGLGAVVLARVVFRGPSVARLVRLAHFCLPLGVVGFIAPVLSGIRWQTA